MDIEKNITAAAPVATLTIVAQDLLALSARELWVLRSAIVTIVDVACACSCQPKFDTPHNRAAAVMDQVIDTFNELNGALSDEAERRLGSDPRTLAADDAELLGFVHVGYVVEQRDSMSRVAVLAATAVETERKAAFHSSRKAGA